MADVTFDDGLPYVDDADPLLAAAHTWEVAKKPNPRINKVRKLIDAGAMHLHPDHVDWVRWVLNWDQVDRSLPTFSRKADSYRDKVRPMRLGEYRIYCLDLLMPTVVLVQQVMNYRTRQGRSLYDVPNTGRPVSRSRRLLDPQGRPVAGVLHTYASDAGLLEQLQAAAKQVREARQRGHGWDPLLDSVLSVGVENGGLWLQTVFAPVGDDGHPNWSRAVGALAPADAASRKAVCDFRIDPEGKLAGLPLFKPRRSDLYDTDRNATEAVDVDEAVSVQLGKVKSAISGTDFLDDLPGEARELLHASVMPVRLAYRVTDSRGRDVQLDGPALFRQIQKHFHGPEHLGHPPTEAERLVADDAYAALRQAIEDGAFQDTTGSATHGVAWTVPILDAVCGTGPLADLTPIGVPPTWQGRVAAAIMLVFGDGPERAILGRLLKSRPQAGLYSDRLDQRRLALLREWIFGETVANRRTFDLINAKALFEDPLRGWNGDIDYLIRRVQADEASDTEMALYQVLATTAAGLKEMQLVDRGSAEQARGFASLKADQALRGRSVRVEKGGELVWSFIENGPHYMRAFLQDRLLLADPRPSAVDGITPEAPTDADWQVWQEGKIGRLEEDGTPITRQVRAAVTVGGQLIQEQDGTVRYELIEVPDLVPADFLDAYSSQALTRRAKEQHVSVEDKQQARPISADEQVMEALEDAVNLLTGLDTHVGSLEGLQKQGHVFDEGQRRGLGDLALDIRGAANSQPPEPPALAERIDTMVRTARKQEARLQSEQLVIAQSNRAEVDDDGLEEDEGGAEDALAFEEAE